MDRDESLRLIALLEEIRDRQTQALAMQKEQLELVRRQIARAERLQDRAEELQAKSAGIMRVAGRTLWVVLPIVAALILYLGWLLLR